MLKQAKAAVAFCSAIALFFLIHCQTTPKSGEGNVLDLSAYSVHDFQTGVLASFQEHCARCHGSYGSMYLLSLQKLNYTDMKDEVYEMMIGPSQLTPTEIEVEVMTDYHIAIQKRVPFASITNARSFLQSKDTHIYGEASPDSSVTIVKDGQSYIAAVEKDRWTVNNPPAPPFTIQVSNEDHSLSFEFPKQQWLILANEEERNRSL